MTATGAEAAEAVEAGPEPLRRYGVIAAELGGVEVLFPTVGEYHDLIGTLRNEGFVMCIDVCGVDYLTHPGRALPGGVEPGRFEVVVNLIDHVAFRRVRVRLQVDGEEPTVPTIWDLYPGVEAMERETYDMFGIVFSGHPDLSRILMPEDWVGFPLRKDYSQGRIPVQFKAPGGEGAGR